MSQRSSNYQWARMIILVLILVLIGYALAFSAPTQWLDGLFQPAPTVASLSATIRRQEADLVRNELDAATLAGRAGQVNQAAAFYRKALVLSPSAHIYAQLVTTLVAADSIPQAAMVLDEALARFPDDANLLQLQADVQANQ